MSMTDEEIERLIEQHKRNDSLGGFRSDLYQETIDALRQLHDEVKALREDGRRLDWLQSRRKVIEFGYKCDDVDEPRTALIFDWPGGVGVSGQLRSSVDAALSQEDNQ